MDVRRPLTDDEFARLLEAARAGLPLRGLAGPDRAMLYLVAGTTGLRASELASLTAGSFVLDATTPVVAVEAAYSKHRRRDEVPLHPALVSELRVWLQRRAVGDRPADQARDRPRPPPVVGGPTPRCRGSAAGHLPVMRHASWETTRKHYAPGNV